VPGCCRCWGYRTGNGPPWISIINTGHGLMPGAPLVGFRLPTSRHWPSFNCKRPVSTVLLNPFLCYSRRIMTFSIDSTRKLIEQRISLRIEAGLPPLSVADEVQRAKKVHDEAEFERFFESQRHRFIHLWSDSNRGFLTNASIWSAVRNKIRDELLKGGG
jgi:hypothetical protein